MRLIDNNGAPAGEKHFVFYNPPVVNEQLGIRRSSVLETQKSRGAAAEAGHSNDRFCPQPGTGGTAAHLFARAREG